MKRRQLFFLVIINFTFVVKAQNDSISKPRKAYGAAFVETVGINLGVWAFDRFALNADFAKISLTTMGNNFRHELVWDNNLFPTNLLGHPYHGGLYFNAARANGLNFWKSAPYTVAGSLMWEYLMETEPPSINDFIATSIGGIALGEITYRLSDLFIDNSTRGFQRFGHEFLTAIISPMRGLNRIISGEAWKHSNYTGDLSDDIPVQFAIQLGHRALAEDSARIRFYNGVFLDLKLIYGNMFSEDNEKPYDAFTLRAGFNLFSKQPIISNVNVVGQLWGTDVKMKRENQHFHWGFFQHFDYYDSNTVLEKQRQKSYRIAQAAALGAGGQFAEQSKRGNTFMLGLYFNGILLGGNVSDYYQVTDRDYNLGSGFSSKLNIGFMFKNKMTLMANVSDYRIYTWKGYEQGLDLSQLTDSEQLNLNAQGDAGNASLSVAAMSFNYILLKHIVLSTETSFYIRHSNYKYHPAVNYRIIENRIGVGWLL